MPRLCQCGGKIDATPVSGGYETWTCGSCGRHEHIKTPAFVVSEKKAQNYGAYLYRSLRPSQKAHLWGGEDTLCRMYSTGGFKKDSMTVHETTEGREICTMCIHMASK